MTTQTATWDGSAGSAERIRATIWWLAVALKRAWARRRTRLIISDLDDHVLRDIGLNPRDVRPAAPSLRSLSVGTEGRLMAPVVLGR
jgi:uncharacterized protein YjiS (DUF1127 family)